MPLNKRSFRDLHGILLLDKPSGMSSNGVLQRVRYLYAAKKAGHTGSLDPLASGLLPICFGEATKFSVHLLESDKRYQVRMALGMATDTADRDGQPIARCEVPALSEPLIEQALLSHRGDIMQVPPMYSALKHDGQRLYELARQGREVERPARSVRIHSLTLLGLGEHFIELDVVCSKGTYIRTLVEDIAKKLGTLAHVDWLRRTEVADRCVETAYCLKDLEGFTPERRESLLLPVDALVSQFDRIDLNEESTRKAAHGNPFDIDAPRAQPGTWLRLYGPQGFLGLGEWVSAGRIEPRRMLRTTD